MAKKDTKTKISAVNKNIKILMGADLDRDLDVKIANLESTMSKDGKTERQIRRAVSKVKVASESSQLKKDKEKFQRAKASLFKRAYQGNFVSGDRKFTDLSFLGVELDEAENATIDYIIPLLAEFYLEEGIFPYSRKELYSIYRYFAKYDAIAASAIDTWVNIPLSKLRISYPKTQDEDKKEVFARSRAYFTETFRTINPMRVLEQQIREFLIIGDVFLYVEVDDSREKVSRIFTLPPEYVDVTKSTFIAEPSYRLRVNVDPDRIPEGWGDRYKDGYLDLSTNPNDGSYLIHTSRNRGDYERYGESLFARNLRTLFTRVRLYKIRGIDITRNLNPIEIISAKGASEEQLADLEEQVDVATVDTQYKIVANYEIDWKRIGVGEGLYNLTPEWEQSQRELFIGLLLNEDMLATSRGALAGLRIRLEVVNRRFLQLRELLSTVWEEQILRPQAIAKKFYYIDHLSKEKVYVYPSMGFKRLPLRDDQELFQSVFSLYQKGSIPIELILDLLGLDSEEDLEKMRKNLLTVRDPNFNEVLRGLYATVAEKLVDDTDIIAKIKKELGLHTEIKASAPEDGEGGGGGVGGSEEEFPGAGMVPEGGGEGEGEGEVAGNEEAAEGEVGADEAGQGPVDEAGSAEVQEVP